MDMRDLMILFEGKAVKVEIDDQLPFRVYINPTPQQMMSGRQRGLIDTEGNLYVWDAYQATHDSVANELGITWESALLLEPDKIEIVGGDKNLENWVHINRAYGGKMPFVENSQQYPAETFMHEAEASLAPMSGNVSAILIPQDGDTVEINHISAMPMRSGWGTKAMNIIVSLADRCGVTLTLEVDNDSDDWGHDDEDESQPTDDTASIPSNDDLMGWYGGYGFSVADGLSSRIQMVRKPNTALPI
jgi:hypothetical protein